MASGRGLCRARAPLDFGNSGTGCRLVMGAVAGCPITAIFDGDASLRSRPMRRILDPLERWARKRRQEGGRTAAADPHGAREPMPITYKTAGRFGADQVCRAAGGARRARNNDGHRERSHPRPYRTDAEALWRRHYLGAGRSDGRRITLIGQPELMAPAVVVPADPSSAAFPMVGALIVQGSDVVLRRGGDPLVPASSRRCAKWAPRSRSHVRGDGGEDVAVEVTG